MKSNLMNVCRFRKVLRATTFVIRVKMKKVQKLMELPFINIIDLNLLDERAKLLLSPVMWRTL